MMGYRIASEELHGEKRAEYGAKIIKKLSKELSTEYGKGFTKTNIYNFYSFYKTYPEIFHSASGKSHVNGMRKKRFNKHGVLEHYNVMFLHSTITVCFRLKRRIL